MPPCSCMAWPATSTAAAHAYDLAIDAATPASGSPGSRQRAATAAPTQLAGHADLHQHVGAGVLDGLERADRAAELLAHARRRRRSRPAWPRLRPRLSQATATAARSSSRGDAGPRIAGEPPHRRLGHRRRRPPSTRPSRRVASRTGCGGHAEPGRARRDDGDHRRAVRVEGQQQELVGVGGVGDEGRPPVQPEPAARPPRSSRRNGGRVLVAVAVGQRDGQDDLPAGDVAEQLVPAGRALQQVQRADAEDDGAQVRAARRGPAQLGQDDGGLGEGGVLAVERARHLEPQPPGSGQLPPVGLASRGRLSRAGRAPPPGARRGSRRTSGSPGQAEPALADDGALDLAGAARDRPLPGADEVEHPGARLPAARDRLGAARRGPASPATSAPKSVIRWSSSL